MEILILLITLTLKCLSDDVNVTSLRTVEHSRRQVTNLPRIRHKSFAFSGDNTDDTDVVAAALASKDQKKPKSVLGKLVREPVLGEDLTFNYLTLSNYYCGLQR